MKKNVAVVILAAGLGTRMKSDKAKVLHEVQGKPMILYVVEVARKIVGDNIVVVIGNQAQTVREIMGHIERVTVVEGGTRLRLQQVGEGLRIDRLR